MTLTVTDFKTYKRKLTSSMKKKREIESAVVAHSKGILEELKTKLIESINSSKIIDPIKFVEWTIDSAIANANYDSLCRVNEFAWMENDRLMAEIEMVS